MPTTTTSRALTLLIGALALGPATALGQAGTGKPIRVIVPFPAGGGVD